MLASALRTDPHCFRRLEPTDPTIVELREWSRPSDELTRERVRLANRMQQQLWRYYPQFLDAVDGDVAAPWALDLWRSLPTPRAGQRVREVTLTRALKQHRIRRTDAATLRDKLRAPAVKVRHRARAGEISVMGGAPYGYRYLRKRDDAPASHVVVEAEARVVRDIYEHYTVTGWSIEGICRWLNE